MPGVPQFQPKRWLSILISHSDIDGGMLFNSGEAGVTARSGMPRWLGVASRTLAALFGGYGLASLAVAACAVALPMARSDAVLTGMMVGLVVQAAAAIWVFSAASALRAWLGLAAPGVALGLLIQGGGFR